MKIPYAKFQSWIRLQIILNKRLPFKDGFGIWGYHLKYGNAKGAETATVVYQQKGMWVYWFTNEDDANGFAKKNHIKTEIKNDKNI